MDPIRTLSGIPAQPRIGERKQGQQGDPEAFRRAMGEESGDTASEPEPDPKPKRPVGRSLQAHGRPSRRDLGEARHIDVVA